MTAPKPRPGPGPRIRVRRATASDAPAIRRIAHGWWAAYRGLLLDETIVWFLELAYSEERVDLRIERNETWVALADEVVGLFAETVIEPDRITLVAIYADPALRGMGLGTAALSMITAAHPDLPVVADVLVGNAAGESFYAARGSAPREPIDEQLGTELARERRWWLEATGGGGS